MKYANILLKTKKTIFNYNDIKNLLWITNKNTIKSFFNRAVSQWILQNIYKGIYTFIEYDKYELWSKLKINSYISFETVLKKHWLIFQDYWDSIFLASNDSITKKVQKIEFKYFKLKNDILFNPLGIINKWSYMIASKERAICDRIYLSKDYYFDNIEGIDKEKLLQISKIYNNRVILEVNKLLKNA